MKLHYFFKEAGLFFLVFIFFVAPSIFQSVPAENAFSEWNFPLSGMIFSFLSFLIIGLEFNTADIKNIFIHKITKAKLVLDSSIFFVGFGALFLCSAIFQFSAFICGYSNVSAEVLLPNNFCSIFFCLLTFLSGAVLEENIFRIYIPAFSFSFFREKKLNKLAKFAVELFPAMLFALCHRYLGIFAVLNAFFAHFILRKSFLKSSSPILSYLIHFFYNIFNLIFMAG